MFERFSHFGEYLRYLRVNANLSMKIVANKLGYKSPQAWREIEFGRNTFKTKFISELAKILKVDPTLLIKAHSYFLIKSDAKACGLKLADLDIQLIPLL